MAISPVGAVSTAAASALPALPALPAVPANPGTAAPASNGFGEKLTGAIDNLQALQASADRLALEAALGQLTNVHDYMIAATQASLATELTVAVRNKAVDAFNQIMQMGV